MNCFRVIVIAAIVASSTAALSQIRKYSNEFQSIGVGARGLAMAQTQVATVNDATGSFYNPAALMRLQSNINLSLMHAEYFAGIAKFDYGAFAIPLKDKSRVIGLSVTRFAVDDIPNTLHLFDKDGTINYDNIITFSEADWAFLFSYAQRFRETGLSFGGNAKIIYRIAGDFATAWGFGLDLSAAYDIKQFRFGIMAKDVTSTFNAWAFTFTDEEKRILTETGNILPQNSLEVTVPKLIFGAAYEVNIKDKFKILPELDFEMTTDGKRNVPIKTNVVSFDPRFGLELSYANIIFLRGGIGNIQKITEEDSAEEIITYQPSAGIGLKIKTFTLDYAFTDIANQSTALYSHVFSLGLGINKRKQ